MASGPTPIDSQAPGGEVPGGSSFQRRVQWIFLGTNGIRAGWRMLMAFALFFLFLFVVQAGLKRIPPLEAWRHAQPKAVDTPWILLLGEGIATLSVLLAALVMTFIEKRSFADYGLPGNAAFGKRFWQGVPYGFAMLTALMALIAALHGFSLDGWALGRAAALRNGFLYLMVFILVAIFEEFSFRGYLQATLASGIGFWPAAILLAIGFGALHLENTGEARLGALAACVEQDERADLASQHLGIDRLREVVDGAEREARLGALAAGCFGLLAAFSLWRTGNIWFPIGMHAAWDWGETYFYSVPDSGAMARGHLLNSSFHGANWLTGGTVGPEGSLFVFVVLGLGAVGVHYLFPARPKVF